MAEAYCAACNNSFSVDHEYCPNDGAKLVKLTARPDLLIGRVFDNRYEIRSALGHGGMGTVYRGWQRSVDREVAIKVIHPKLSNDLAVAKRFLREARLCSRLSQPNIVNVYDFGQSEDGILFLVMELLRGRTLSKDLETGKPLPLARIRTIGRQLCDALDAAHSQGIVHRDLKPGNIVILDEPPGRDLLKVLDFGLAKSLLAETTSLVTQTDALLGTPLYMAPEQVVGKPSDARADLYSLGCILYQMASGRPPFVGANINATLAAHVERAPDPLPLAIPPSIAATIARLMQKDADARFQSARLVHDALNTDRDSLELREDVGPALAGDLAHYAAAPVSIGSVSPPTRRATPLIIAITGLALLSVIAIVVVWQVRRGSPPAVDTSPIAGEVDGRTPAATDAADLGIGTDVAIVDVLHIDARVRRIDAGIPVRPPADARVRTPRPDAATVSIDAATPPPTRIDAGLPDIDLLPTRPKKR